MKKLGVGALEQGYPCMYCIAGEAVTTHYPLQARDSHPPPSHTKHILAIINVLYCHQLFILPGFPTSLRAHDTAL